MNSIERLKELAQNPFYTPTEEERNLLEEAEKEVDSKEVNTRPKVFTSKESVLAKEKGSLEKNNTSIVSE